MHRVLLILHILGASVWAGGHLILSLSVLPRALRTRSLEAIQAFEERFEKIGIPALIVQVLTGILLALRLMPASKWFDFENPVSRGILVKLGLISITVALALHARLVLIPKLTSERLAGLAWHIAGVTLAAVLLVVTGVSFRFGGSW